MNLILVNISFNEQQKMQQKNRFIKSFDKIQISGGYLETIENIQQIVYTPRAVSVKDFHHCFYKWEQYLHRCLASQGNYFEGDIIDL